MKLEEAELKLDELINEIDRVKDLLIQYLIVKLKEHDETV